MQTYTVEYWAEYNDQSTDFYVDVVATDPEHAIELAKVSSRIARRGKHFEATLK